MNQPMSFDQGEFNFEANGPEDGYRKWRAELVAKQHAFEARWGVILSRRVRVSLTDHAKPLVGMLELLAGPQHRAAGRPRFRLKGLEFSPADIASIVQVD